MPVMYIAATKQFGMENVLQIFMLITYRTSCSMPCRYRNIACQLGVYYWDFITISTTIVISVSNITVINIIDGSLGTNMSNNIENNKSTLIKKILLKQSQLKDNAMYEILWNYKIIDDINVCKIVLLHNAL